MPNYQLADYGMFDPNSEWAKQAAAQVIQQQQAQQQTPTAPQAAAQPALQAAPIPNNNGLAAKAANVLTPLDDAGRALASQIARFKMNYDAAQAAGDTAGMAQAHAGAEALRNAAGKYGVDLSRLGANDSTAAYQAMLQADYAKGVADVANMLTPQEYYQQQIQQNMANGMSRRRAEDSALGALEAYEGQYRRTLGNALSRYGYNDRGEINRYGMQIANLMYNQNPQSVGLIDQWAINPRDQWRFDKNVDVMNLQHGFQNDTMDRKFNYNMAAQQNQQNFAEHMALLNQALGLDTEEKRLQFANKYPDAAALIYGRRSGGGSGSGNGSGGISATKQADAMGKLAGLKAGLMNKSLSIADFEQKAAELLPFADADTAAYLEELKYVRNFLDEYEAGHDKMALSYWNAIEDDNQLLSEVPAEIVADMRKRTAGSKKNVSSAGGSVTATPTNVDQATKAWAASIVGDAQQRAEEEKQRREQKSREAYAALDRWRNGGY